MAVGVFPDWQVRSWAELVRRIMDPPQQVAKLEVRSLRDLLPHTRKEALQSRHVPLVDKGSSLQPDHLN